YRIVIAGSLMLRSSVDRVAPAARARQLRTRWSATMGITSDLSIPSYSGASDDTLLDALRGGDEHAFSELVHRYHATLVRVAMAYVGSRDRAEDVAQEAWLGMLRGIGQFAGRSSLRTWLFRILINCAHADCRRRGRAIVFADLRDDTDEGDAIIEPDRFHPAGHRWGGTDR